MRTLVFAFFHTVLFSIRVSGEHRGRAGDIEKRLLPPVALSESLVSPLPLASTRVFLNGYVLAATLFTIRHICIRVDVPLDAE